MMTQTKKTTREQPIYVTRNGERRVISRVEQLRDEDVIHFDSCKMVFLGNGNYVRRSVALLTRGMRNPESDVRLINVRFSSLEMDRTNGFFKFSGEAVRDIVYSRPNPEYLVMDFYLKERGL